MSAIKTKKSDISDSKVRVEVEVAVDEVEAKLNSSARTLAKSVKLPGFRQGKVPPQLLIQRLGREEVFQQALRDNLGTWYEGALNDAAVRSIGEPDIKLGELPGDGQPLTFTVEVGTTPKAKLAKYKGIEVPRREPQLPADVVDQEIERLRESIARLESVERELKQGDFAVVDFVGTVGDEKIEGGEARDYTLEIGSKSLIDDFEEQLVGAKPGESRRVEVTFPTDYKAEELAGKDATFEVKVKSVQEKILPELDDNLALEASEFESLAELRADIEEKLITAQERTIEEEFREAVVDAVAEKSKINLTAELIDARSQELWDSMAHRLGHQGITVENYLKVIGKSQEELLAELKPQAEQTLKRESVIAAAVEAEKIEAEEEALLAALQRSAEQEGTTKEKLLQQLRQAGRDRLLIDDVKARKAVDRLVELAKPISVERAEAREKIWTPGSATLKDSELEEEREVKL